MGSGRCTNLALLSISVAMQCSAKAWRLATGLAPATGAAATFVPVYPAAVLGFRDGIRVVLLYDC